MKATEILSNEHRIIEQVLDCLEQILTQANAEGKLDAAAAGSALDFFRAFADQCHHAKEEAHLFPAMESKGFPRQGGPTGVMLAEHDEGRSCVRAMNGTTAAAAQGDAAALQRFTEAGRHYIDLLRDHIAKEDHCLFSMATQALNESDQAELLAKFERVEREEMAGVHEKYLAIANALADRYEVPRRDAVLAGHADCGCGCQH